MRWRFFIAGIAATLVAGAIGAAAFVTSGVYNVAATSPHSQPMFDVIALSLRRSIALRAGDVELPPDFGSGPATRGMAAYHAHCVQCHGAPGVAPEAFALGMNPVPINLHFAVANDRPEEAFWVIKHGIKMTGMPGWDYRFTDEQIWDLTTFVARLPNIAPVDYRDLLAEIGLEPPPIGDVPEVEAAGADARGDPANGRRAVAQYGCHMCHRIPGVTGRDVYVGPPLEGMAERKYIAGILANTPENMVRWLRDPPANDPLTAMPHLGVSEAHAWDIAAYLATLERDDGG